MKAMMGKTTTMMMMMIMMSIYHPWMNDGDNDSDDLCG